MGEGRRRTSKTSLSTEDTEGHGERQRQLQHLLSAEDAEGRGELHNTFFVHGGHGELQKPLCPRRTRRGTENGNGNFNIFCPRRTRRGAENGNGNFNIFCPRRTRRGAENGNGNFNIFCPRRTRRGAENFITPFLSTEGTENFKNLFVHGGHGELQEPFCPRRGRGRSVEGERFHGEDIAAGGFGLVGCHDQIVAGRYRGAEEEPGVTQEEAGAVVPADGLSGAGTSSEA